MLLNRNAMIRDQLQQTMIKESAALAALSENAFDSGDYRDALEYALDALPGRDPSRPYSAEAEKALVSELYLYSGEYEMRYRQSFEQDTQIRTAALSADGRYFASGDRFGKIRVYDMDSGELLWSAEDSTETLSEIYAPDIKKPVFMTYSEDLLLVKYSAGGYAVFSADGTLLRSGKEDYILFVSEEKGMILNCTYRTVGLPARITDIRTGDVLFDLGTFDSAYTNLLEGAISPDGKYAAVLAMDPERTEADLYLFDLESGERKMLHSGYMYSAALTSFGLRFEEDNDLALCFCARDDSLLTEEERWKGNFVTLFDHTAGWKERFSTDLDFGSPVAYRTDEESEMPDHLEYVEMYAWGKEIEALKYIDYMECKDSGIVTACRKKLVKVDADSGEVCWQTDLPDRVKTVHYYQQDASILILILADGTITFCSLESGDLSYSFNLPYFDCHYDLYTAAVTGTSLKNTQMAVIPSQARGRASVISFGGGADREIPAWVNEKMADPQYYLYFFTSPSGKKTAAVYSPYDYYTAPILALDGLEENDPDRDVFIISEISDIDLRDCLSRAVLTDTGKMIMNGIVFDLGSKSTTGLTESGEAQEEDPFRMSASCVDRKNSKVLTASVEKDPSGEGWKLLLWEDGVFTGKSSVIPGEVLQDPSDPSFKQELCCCRAVSAPGYAVVCVPEQSGEQWRYLLYDLDADTWEDMEYLRGSRDHALALGESHPWIAFQGEEGEVCLFDVSGSGKRLFTTDGALPDKASALFFAKDDEYLIVFDRTGSIVIYSTSDGKVLHRSSYAEQNVSFESDAHYEVHCIPETGRILLLYDEYDLDINYTKPLAITIDEGSMLTTGVFREISSYYPSEGKVLMNYRSEKPCFIPLYSVEEMQETAEILLAGTGGEKAKK